MDTGRVCAMVSAVKCVNLAIHRPVPLGLIIHYMFTKKFKKIVSVNTMVKFFNTSATTGSHLRANLGRAVWWKEEYSEKTPTC